MGGDGAEGVPPLDKNLLIPNLEKSPHQMLIPPTLNSNFHVITQ